MHLTRHILPNGATLLLMENHQAPVVYFSIGVRVGSFHESNPEAGLSHILEHMLFKGTQNLKVGELAKIIEGSGGDVNAYTSFDETVYYATFSSRYWERSLEALSDSVLNAVIDPQELAREKEVVLEEILRGKDNPNRSLSQALFSQAYPKHPYARPIIGYEKNVRNFSQSTVYNFYKKHYSAPNMVVLLAGDFPLKKAFHRLEKVFGPLPKKPKISRKEIKLKKQSKPQSLVLSKEVQGHNLAIAFGGPSLRDPDLPLLDLLSHVLGEGDHSRLDTQVKEKKSLAHSVYSHVFSPTEPGLFMIGATLDGRKVPSALQAIEQELKKIQDQGIKSEELRRAKLNIKSDAIYEKETIQGLGRKYAYYENILGHYDFEQRYYQAIEEATTEEVTQVARDYLKETNLNLALLQPKKTKHAFKAPQLIKAFQKGKKFKSPKKSTGPEFVTLKNGLRIVFYENHLTPTVVIRSAHVGGLRAEDKRTNGIHYLFSQLWARSTAKYSTLQLARRIEKTAGSFDAYTGRNLSGLKGDFLSEKIEEGLDIFLDAWINPRLDPKEIQFEKASQLEAIRREKDQASHQCFVPFFKHLYPLHPYGRPLLGESQLVKTWSRQDLIRCHGQLLNPKQSILAVVGDFDREEVLEKIVPSLEKLKVPRQKIKKLAQDPPPKKRLYLEDYSDKLQAHLIYGFQGLTYQDKDRYALDILNNLLSGQGGRLFLELRDKMSLAYTITTLNQEGLEPGYFGIYMGTEGSKVEVALEAIEKEIKKLLKKGLSKIEVDRAKRALVGAYEIDLQRKSMVATQLAFNEIYGLPRDEWRKLPDKILKVSHRAVEAVARKVLNMDRAIISVLRPRAS